MGARGAHPIVAIEPPAGTRCAHPVIATGTEVTPPDSVWHMHTEPASAIRWHTRCRSSLSAESPFTDCPIVAIKRPLGIVPRPHNAAILLVRTPHLFTSRTPLRRTCLQPSRTPCQGCTERITSSSTSNRVSAVPHSAFQVLHDRDSTSIESAYCPRTLLHASIHARGSHTLPDNIHSATCGSG